MFNHIGDVFDKYIRYTIKIFSLYFLESIIHNKSQLSIGPNERGPVEENDFTSIYLSKKHKSPFFVFQLGTTKFFVYFLIANFAIFSLICDGKLQFLIFFPDKNLFVFL